MLQRTITSGGTGGAWQGLHESRRNLATVKLPSRLTTADELLLQRDYDDAIAAYKERLGEDPQDVSSLYALWALLTFGTDDEGSHQDTELGKHYGERLRELIDSPYVRQWVESSFE